MQVIRVTQPSELQKCLEIRTEVFVNEQKVPMELEVDKQDASPEASHHFLILEGDRGISTGRWYAYKPGTAKFQRIAVRKEYRGNKFGEQIVHAMEKQAQEYGMKRVVLDAQCHAESFYRKLGYRTVSEEPFEDAGIPHVRMEKEL